MEKKRKRINGVHSPVVAQLVSSTQPLWQAISMARKTRKMENQEMSQSQVLLR